ncbi:MAG: UbiA family prenyltransferase [Candidatus Paceibacterota bacterium]
MKTINVSRFFRDEFVYGGHLLSLGAVGIVASVMMLNNFYFDIKFITSVYLIAQTVYFYNRIKEYESDNISNPNRNMHLSKYRNYFLAIIIFYIIVTVAILISFNDVVSSSAGLLLLFSGIMYSEYFKNKTRNYIGFKNYYVAFFWSFLVLFTALYYHASLNATILIFFIFVLLRWLINTTFFDIKDIESDKQNNLKTIPVYFGKKRTLDMLSVINLISFFPLFIGIYFNLLPVYFASLIVFYFYSLFYIMKARTEGSSIRNLSYIMVDGEYVFWPIILLLFK